MPFRGRTSDLTILVAAGVATLLLSVASFLVAPVSSTPALDGSSLSTHPSGARATYLALKEAGYDMQQSFEPVSFLRASPTAVLIVAEPLRAPSQLDARALLAFIERGGIVLATGALAGPFLPGVPAPQSRGGATEAGDVNAALPSALSTGVPRIVMPTAPGALAGSSYLTIYGTDARPAVAAARFGAGLAIWWAGPTPLTNENVSEPGHVELLVNMLGPPGRRQIFWDEHYHGHTRSVLSYAAGTPAPFAAAQLGIVFLAALLTYSRRRWPVRGLHVEPRSSPLEFVESMGSLYQRANTAAGAVATVRTRVRRTLTAACGLPPHVSDEHLSQAAALRVSIDAARLREVLATSAQAAVDPHLSAETARRTVQELQDVAAALRAARRGRS
jgi:hypothetical protein